MSADTRKIGDFRQPSAALALQGPVRPEEQINTIKSISKVKRRI